MFCISCGDVRPLDEKIPCPHCGGMIFSTMRGWGKVTGANDVSLKVTSAFPRPDAGGPSPFPRRDETPAP